MQQLSATLFDSINSKRFDSFVTTRFAYYSKTNHNIRGVGTRKYIFTHIYFKNLTHLHVPLKTKNQILLNVICLY